jgi:hypothetical protein
MIDLDGSESPLHESTSDSAGQQLPTYRRDGVNLAGK